MRILAVVWKTFGSFACDPFCSENKWDEERQVTKPTFLLQSCRSHTYFWQVSFPLQSCHSRMQKMTPAENARHVVSGATAMEREPRLSKIGTWAAALYQERRLCHLAFLVIFLSKMDHKRKTRMFSKLNHAAWSEISTRCRRDRSPQLICH